jgi:membrane protein YdbS with pleckstrin-like domain
MATLRETHPLSPRKFWKKMIPVFIGGSVLVLILSYTIGGLQLAAGVFPTLDLQGYGFLSTIFAGYLLFIGLYGWYVRTYIRIYYYDADSNFVTIKKGVFAPEEIHVQYIKVQDVYVDQDIADRILGLYDVHLASATASSAMEAHIDGVERTAAEGLKSLLLKNIQTPVPIGQSLDSSEPEPLEQSDAVEVDISNRNYPIGGKWVLMVAINKFFTSVFYSVFIILWAGASLNDSFLSPIFGMPVIFVGIILFAIIFISNLVYLLIWRGVYGFEFLPDYVLMRTGVISRSEIHIPYRTIQDININQGIVEWILGIATVVIENASAAQIVGKKIIKPTVTIPGQSLSTARQLGEIIRKTVLQKNSTRTGV